MQSLKHLLQFEIRSDGTSQFQLTALGEEYVELSFGRHLDLGLIALVPAFFDRRRIAALRARTGSPRSGYRWMATSCTSSLISPPAEMHAACYHLVHA